MGHRTPGNVVAVSRVAELRSWLYDPAAATVRLGAGVTYAEVMTEPLAALLPALAQAARTVGSPQIRHAATVGGNVGTSSPAGDGLPALAALDAVVHLESAIASRDVPFSEFASGPKRTVRRPGELITAITLPVLRGWQGYAKVGVRNAMVIATATCCLAVDEEAANVRIALGSVGPVIIRAAEAEAFAAANIDWSTRSAGDDVVARIGELAAAAARPIDDHRSTADYRRHAIGVLAARLARRAFADG
jgi:CO/xanthine dehydrogenase FAD-binding subunit